MSADDGGDTCDEREDDDGADDSIEDSSKEVTKYPSILRGPRASRSASLHRVCMVETTSCVKSLCLGMEAACVSEEYNHISSCVLLFGDLEEIVFIGILSTAPGGGQLVVLPAYVPGTKVYRCSTYTSRANYALISGIPAKVSIDKPKFLPSVLLVDWVEDISAITSSIVFNLDTGAILQGDALVPGLLPNRNCWGSCDINKTQFIANPIPETFRGESRKEDWVIRHGSLLHVELQYLDTLKKPLKTAWLIAIT